MEEFKNLKKDRKNIDKNTLFAWYNGVFYIFFLQKIANFKRMRTSTECEYQFYSLPSH